MWLSNSSIGRKVVMSLTGLFLILFLTFHVLMNAVALFSIPAYEAVCAFLGANWYAVLGTAVIAAGAVLHICYALWLTIQNRKARGNNRYEVSKKPATVEWASQNMFVLGIIIVCFLAIHMVNFWVKMQLPEFLNIYTSCDYQCVASGAEALQAAFACPYTLVIYLVAFAALWFHLTHGIWSALQTLGTSGNTWLPRLKAISLWWATIVCALFAVEAIALTIKFAGCC